VSLFLLYVLQEVQDAPKIMGPDALIKAKIKQTRFRWAGAGCQNQSATCFLLFGCTVL
jgi:hypothetical protein